MTGDSPEYLDHQLTEILTSFHEQTQMEPGSVFVVGCSTSEVIGAEIGTSGTMKVAEFIFKALREFHEQHQVHLAFQCCEHLNRAIVMEREVAQQYNYEQVSVVPIRSAGGALGTFAYHHLKDPVVVEHIKADAGIDIGDTFIGMHLKHVAVPVRTKIRELGHAHVTLATTRPKLIGGVRAVYIKEDTKQI